MHYYEHHLSNLWETPPQKSHSDCLDFNLRLVPEFFRFRHIHHLSNRCRAKYLSLCLKNAEKAVAESALPAVPHCASLRRKE